MTIQQNITSAYSNCFITGNDAGTLNPNGITEDVSKNIYSVNSSGSNNSTYLVKHNSSGTYQWALNCTFIKTGKGVVTDSSGNVYFTGQDLNVSPSRPFIAKFNSSGTNQWKYYYSPTPTTTNTIQGNNIYCDSSDNIYSTASEDTGASGSYSGYLLKYNTSGSLLFQRKYQISGVTTSLIGVCTDSANNLYAVGTTTESSLQVGYFVKYNSSGTLQWIKKLSSSSAVTFGGMSIDTNDNIYVVGSQNSLTAVFKYNTSGSLQWAMRYTGSLLSSVDLLNNINCATDVVGNLFISFRSGSIICIAPTGSVIWQNYFSASGAVYPNFNGAYLSPVISAFNINSYLYFGADKTGTNRNFIAKIPANPSKTATYTLDGTNLVYAVNSYYGTTSSTSLTSSVTEGTSAVTESTPTGTLTSSSSSVSSYTATSSLAYI